MEDTKKKVNVEELNEEEQDMGFPRLGGRMAM